MRGRRWWTVEDWIIRMTGGEPLRWDDLVWFTLVVLMAAGIVLTLLAAMGG